MSVLHVVFNQSWIPMITLARGILSTSVVPVLELGSRKLVVSGSKVCDIIHGSLRSFKISTIKPINTELQLTFKLSILFKLLFSSVILQETFLLSQIVYKLSENPQNQALIEGRIKPYLILSLSPPLSTPLSSLLSFLWSRKAILTIPNPYLWFSKFYMKSENIQC